MNRKTVNVSQDFLVKQCWIVVDGYGSLYLAFCNSVDDIPDGHAGIDMREISRRSKYGHRANNDIVKSMNGEGWGDQTIHGRSPSELFDFVMTR